MYYILFLNLIQGYFVPSLITCVDSIEALIYADKIYHNLS